MTTLSETSQQWLGLRDLRRLVSRYYYHKLKEKEQDAVKKLISKITDNGDTFQFFFDPKVKNPPKYSKKMKTAYKVDPNKDEFFSLESLVVFVKSVLKSKAEYIKICMDAAVKRVPFTQRTGLLNYLRGKDNDTRAKDGTPYKNPHVVYPGDKLSKTVTASDEAEAGAGTQSDKRQKTSDITEVNDENETTKKKKSKKSNVSYWENNEQPLATLNSVLDCSNKTPIAENCKPIWTAFLKEERSAVSRNNDGATTTKAKFGTPIIVVPAAATSVISLYNVKDYLEKGNYVPSSEARAKSPALVSEVIIERKHPSGGLMKYKVVNSVRGFTGKHWERVVAVFVIGPAYQFKGWKWKEPAEIFNNCQGIHVYFDDVKLNLNVRSWNVEVFELRKQTRNKDKIQAHRIWESIDKFMYDKKPYLLPQ
mmetsp:Transcript_4431/g.5898  ORF Transcript_4431/g.5898 Transcript_4431/m.5898 type:complete len:422 (+) Transcript_4431:221-1486(+)